MSALTQRLEKFGPAGAVALLLGWGALQWLQGRKRKMRIEEIAEQQLRWWKGKTEQSPGAAEKINEYWAPLGQSQPVDEPWSGAFVSFASVSSDHPEALSPSGAHYYYASQAALDRGKPGRYGAYRPSELKLQPGDIVISTRGTPARFEDLLQSGPFIPLHGDIVTKTGSGSARVIGGNVGNTVSARDFALDSDGHVTQPDVFAVLRRQTAEGKVS